MLAEQDLQRIGQALAGRVPPVELHLHGASDGSELGAALKVVAEAVIAAADRGAVLREGETSSLPASPALTLSGPDRGEIHYLALPEGREAGPFVEALAAEHRADLDAGLVARLRALEAPVELLVFIATQCPHCPQAVKAANELALASKRISVFVIDAERFTDLAAELKVRSVPLTVIDGGLALSGVEPARELAEVVLSRGSPDYHRRHLLSLLETQRFEEALALVRNPGGPEAFLTAWQGSTTNSRVGLLLAAEQLLERAPGALSAIVGGLCDMLGSDDAALRGDTVDLLGRIGSAEAAPALRKLLDDPNPDVAEIAAEVLQELA